MMRPEEFANQPEKSQSQNESQSNDIGLHYTRLYEIIKRLRSKNGCPWDRKQTVESLASDLLEEVYECLDAIQSRDVNHAREELGDLHLLAVFIAFIYEESGSFTLAQVLGEISDKLIRRHPHVFAEAVVASADDVVRQWDEIKRQEKESKPAISESFLDEVPRGFPPLERAFRLQKRCSKKGFDWREPEDVFEKLAEELQEVRELIDESGQHVATNSGNEKQSIIPRMEEEIGDLLFSVVNLSRHYGIDPGIALHMANQKFDRRVRNVESRMKESGLELNHDNLSIMDAFWEDYKQSEK